MVNGPARLLAAPRARLIMAAVLCVVPLRLVWTATLTPGTRILGDCGYDSGGSYCVPDAYIPGRFQITLVSQSPMRVFLVFAAMAFVICAVRPPSAGTRRLAQFTCAVLALGAAVAGAHGAARVLVCVLAALALVAGRVVPDVSVRPALAVFGAVRRGG